MKQNLIKTTSKLVLLAFLFISSFIKAQVVGTWNTSTTQTHTINAVGIGTGLPAAWQEIAYCNSNQKGLIITNTACPGTPLAKPVTFDGEIELGTWLAPGAEGGTPGKIANYLALVE